MLDRADAARTTTDHTPTGISSRVTPLVERLLQRRGITTTRTAEEDLRDIGLSSLDIVNLMLAVEDEFGVKFAERDMTPTNFRSVAKISALVEASAR